MNMMAAIKFKFHAERPFVLPIVGDDDLALV